MCDNAANRLLNNKIFLSVIIDKATLGTETDCLIPMMRGCHRLILVGDQHQLQPILKNKCLVKSGKCI
ncbi:hypothetical protein A3Q56_05473 [Intoshia linei]|uniref:DNA2/NAM7 helicase helicase domain-containing protein n=1 Tax=Intoshia linei TaxID=1819745 RepID=A0A177AZ98_9BILA|nr:hypothetical protein A3Q56_05473 [Intoshia linei]